MTQEAPKKRPVGRPSKYKPEFCERVLELASDGCGWADYAAEFGIDRTTLYDWAAAHEDFSTALSRAKVLEQQWWEKQARTGMFADKFNALVWKTSVQARFRDDYTERKINEVSGPDGGSIKIQTANVDVDALGEEEREALKQLLLAAKASK